MGSANQSNNKYNPLIGIEADNPVQRQVDLAKEGGDTMADFAGLEPSTPTGSPPWGVCNTPGRAPQVAIGRP